jgi:succinate dehydrogenase/fumarate reductase flavoprotein subunit
MPETPEVDVVVVGAGMAGLVASVVAAEDGARVVCVEKQSEPGGALALSGGYVWTVDRVETYKEMVPHGDEALGRVLVEDYETGIEWLEDHGARLERIETGLGERKRFGGYRFVPDTITGAISPLEKACIAAEGTFIVSANASQLMLDDAGAIRGLRYRSTTASHELRCGAVVLSTGGFQGNLEMTTRYISCFADRAYLRSNPGNTGDGLRMALDVGAGTSSGMSCFYGHLLPAPPAVIDPSDFRSLSQFYSCECLVLNKLGERFVDESRGDEICALNLIRQPDAEGFIIFDRVAHEGFVMEPQVPDMMRSDPLIRIQRAGGIVLTGETIDDLAGQMMNRYGVPPRTTKETIEAFNRAAVSREPDQLRVPRRDGLREYSVSPFFAIPVRPGMTFTEGGVRVNTQCQVLDCDGHPIAGLFAAGCDVGGISVEGYVGGLASALVTGLRAGLFAARFNSSWKL